MKFKYLFNFLLLLITNIELMKISFIIITIKVFIFEWWEKIHFSSLLAINQKAFYLMFQLLKKLADFILKTIVLIILLLLIITIN